MSDVARLLPEQFLEVYVAAFGGSPPEEFLEAYELLCDVVYFGTGLKPDAAEQQAARRTVLAVSFDLKGARLLPFKGAVDNRLAAIRAELRKWSVARRRSQEGRPRPDADHRGHLDGARGARHSGTIK